MRRAEKNIASRAEIDTVIRSCLVCRLALAANDEPYLVPVSFGYDGAAIYFHTAPEGRKLDILARNPRVCFEFERNVELVRHPTRACRWTLHYESVIGTGRVTEMLGEADKLAGLNEIMAHYSGREWEMTPTAIEATRVWKVVIDEVSGKRSGRKQT
jgi:nitroimidazol reductase NimA-like FMN-containing flavoprotein (pyridoxamine 5'-phosphate oxidase superfamily)